MRLHIVIGYDGQGSDANPTALYCGPDGDAAIAAMANDTASYRFETILNPEVVRRHNENYQQPAPEAPDIVADQEAAEAAGDPKPAPAPATSSKGWAAESAKAKR